MRMPTAKQKPRKSREINISAPVGGWVANRALAMPRAPNMPPGAAVLENWFPTATGVILRRGMRRHATVYADGPVKAMFTYVSGAKQELFAATTTTIWDITTVASPYAYIISTEDDEGIAVDETEPSALGQDSVLGLDVLDGNTSGDWSVVQFTTAGGTFLIGVNGEDDGFNYDGTSWERLDAGAFPITFPEVSPGVPSTLTTADLSYVWVYQNRIWFIQKDSLSAWYLPVDQVGVVLTEYPLGGVFVRGGTLLWGQSWSLSTGGEGGLSDQCVFCTTEGEVASYQGRNPGDAGGWGKVGTYRVGRPLGKKAIFKAGGDIAVATTVGLISLQAAAQSDYAALGRSAISAPIEDEWSRMVLERGEQDWRCQVWSDGQALFVAPPTPINREPVILCANVNTGAWCRLTQWNATAMEVFQGRFYFGSPDGEIRQGWTGGIDEDLPFTGRLMTLFDSLGAPGSLKMAKNARAIKRSAFTARERVDAHFNFSMDFRPAPVPAPIPSESVWDGGIWNESVWDAERGQIITQDWKSVGGSGADVALAVQVTSGALVPLDVEIVRLDLLYTIADVLT